MSQPNRGLPKLQGGIAKAWREVWSQPCPLVIKEYTEDGSFIGSHTCGKPAAGAIDTLSGPKPICAEHIPGAEERGYIVHRKPHGDTSSLGQRLGFQPINSRTHGYNGQEHR